METRLVQMLLTRFHFVSLLLTPFKIYHQIIFAIIHNYSLASLLNSSFYNSMVKGSSINPLNVERKRAATAPSTTL